MPRWLIASILAIVLSCYGFAALAQNVAGVHLHGQSSGGPDIAQLVADPAAQPTPADDSPYNDAIDTATGHSEPGYDHAEAVDAFQRISRPLRFSEAPARPLPTVTPSPFLERPSALPAARSPARKPPGAPAPSLRTLRAHSADGRTARRCVACRP